MRFYGTRVRRVDEKIIYKLDATTNGGRGVRQGSGQTPKSKQINFPRIQPGG